MNDVLSKPVHINKATDPYLLVQAKDRRITIGKSVISVLKFPSHICLYINNKTNSIVISPCTEDEIMSFRVPRNLFTSHNATFRIHSKAFADDIIEKNNLDANKVYCFTGQYCERQNLVKFSMSQNSPMSLCPNLSTVYTEAPLA